MAEKKKPTSFNLSDQAHDSLEAIANLTGTNKTAAVEIGLAILRQLVEHVADPKRFMALLMQRNEDEDE